MTNLQIKFESHFEDNILRKPIIIVKQGEYNIYNDIVIDFNPIYPNYDEIQNLPSLRYGFFGGIIIVAENVTVDLHGHEIKMSNSFALSQRFFSIFELSNSPFPFNDGLPLRMTKEQWKAGMKITIKNGRLGRSSHSSIHGNDNRQINLIKLFMYDFEVGGIMLNGCKQLFLCKCDIGPNFKNLLVNAKFSAATQLVHHFYNVIPQEREPTKEFKYLQNMIEKTINAKKLEDVPVLFQNPNKVIDGTVYGISIHKSGVAIGGHGKTDQKNQYAFHATFNDVCVHHLTSNVEEKITFLMQEKVLRDISGQIIDVEHILKSKSVDDLIMVQIESKEWLKKYPNFISTFHIPDEFYSLCHNFEFDNMKNYIENVMTQKLGRDIMIHINKGVIAVRIDGVNIIDVNNLIIYDVCNISNKVISSDTYKENMEDVTNYVGNDTIGLCLNNTYDTKINNVSIKNIFSQKGTAYGTIVMNHSKHINIQGVQINMNESLEKHNKIQYGIVIQDSSENVNLKL